MKTTIKILSVLLIMAFINYANANSTNIKDKKTVEKIDYMVIKGKLVDKSTNKPLIFSTVSLQGTNIATITNIDGEFTLKIDKKENGKKLNFSHLGYKNSSIPVSDLVNKRKNKIKLESSSISIEEVKVRPENAYVLMNNVLKKIKDNYPNKAHNMKAFYRETIKKRRKYVGIAEAVVDIYKTPYRKMADDQVKIFKGRKSTSVKSQDTIMFKLQGGPAVAMMLDIIKNPSLLLSRDYMMYYQYQIDNVVTLDNKLHYVVKFKQNPTYVFPLYYGKFYIEMNSLALSRAEFSLNLENIDIARKYFIKKAPFGMKITPKNVKYFVKYREQDSKWYFNYARCEVKYKCKWPKKWFNTNYTTMSEIAVTDRTENTLPIKIERKQRFKKHKVLSDQLTFFADKNFWGELNLIEPDKSIENAIKKISKKVKLK